MRFISQTAPLLGIAALAALSTVAARPVAAQSFTSTTIDYPGADDTYLADINNNGQVIGTYVDSTGNHSFLDTNGSFTTIEFPAAFTDGATVSAINDQGQIVGTYNNGIGYLGDHGFLDTNGVFTTFDDPVSFPDTTMANDINDSGQIVGTYDGDSYINGFLDTNGVFTTVDDPDSVGDAPNLPGGSRVNGINNKGQIVGTIETNTGLQGFIDTNGSFTSFSNPSVNSATSAKGINNSDEVIGFYGQNIYDGFVYSNGVFTPIVGPSGINDAGQIAGSYADDKGFHGYIATPTASVAPEPSSVASVGVVGLFTAGLMLKARRRRTAG